MKRDPEHQETEDRREIEVYAALAERLASGGRTYGAAIMVGICSGILFALGGVVLALLGISGAVEFVVESTSVKARLTNASPGVVIAAMGMLIIWRYKPRLSHDVELRPRGLSSRGAVEMRINSIERALRHLDDRSSQASPSIMGPTRDIESRRYKPDDPTFRSKGSA